jgi:putative transposase
VARFRDFVAGPRFEGALRMARRPRIVSDGAVYHMMARGVRKSDLYIDDDDRRKFLKLLAAAVKKFGCLCYSYNLMGNHYHLVILTTRKNFSRVAQYLNGEYAKYFNRRHKYTGHVFDGRCNAPLIEDNNYLIAALAYVARNPVAANLVKDAADWKWSSYRATIGKCACPRFLTTDWLRRLFGTESVAEACRRFAARVHSHDSDYDVNAVHVRGSVKFEKRMRKVVGENFYMTRVPRRFRAMGRPELDEVFAGVPRTARRKAILRAHIAHGYLFSEIARYLDLHPTTISRIVHRRGTYR